MAEAPRRRSVQCLSPAGLHRMAYREWGDPRNRDVVVCVHGLTRNSLDFDTLARALCTRYRVVCPDVAGRGDSDRLADPRFYVLPQYLADMVTLIARLDVEEVRWLGTSMGGLIGMSLAAQAGSPVKKLILNDAGPVIARAALERIATYLGQPLAFDSLAEAQAYVRRISAPFGPHSDEQWRTLTQSWVRQDAEGRWRPAYDARIAEAYRAAIPANGAANAASADIELWALYDAISCPVLVIRGEQSDLLSRDTARQMTQRGPRARLEEVPGVGHAPTLLHAEQISLVQDFLLGGDNK